MFQQTTIIGRLGNDPEMRAMPNGNYVTSFSVATSRKYKDVEETTWFRISVYGNQAEACNKYLSKGSPVLVVGRLKPDADTGGPRVYQRKDGTSGASFELIAQTVKFLPGGGEGADVADVYGDQEIPF